MGEAGSSGSSRSLLGHRGLGLGRSWWGKDGSLLLSWGNLEAGRLEVRPGS